MVDLLGEIANFKEKQVNKKQDRKCSTPNDILIYKNHAEIVLRSNKQQIVGLTKISLMDIELAKKYKWCLSKTGYASTSMNSKTIKIHMLILNQQYGQIGHHINRDSLDNRRENLKLLLKEEHTTTLHRKEQKQTILKIE